MLKNRVNSLPTNLHKKLLYLLEQHDESFNIWSAIDRINTEDKFLIMKSSHVQLKHKVELSIINK